MIYIIDQRLRAQNVSASKKIRVMEDLLKAMFEQRVIKTMFDTGIMYSNDSWKTLFDKIAHSSIMKLNPTSMSRLYDLMVMAVKYQVTVCKRPQDILLIALNHLDQMRSTVTSNVATVNNLFSPVYDQLKLHYASLSPGTFMNIKFCLLHFFKDYKIRVSLFLKENLQDDRGMFKLDMSGDLPIAYDMPGKIKVHSVDDRQMDVNDFDCGICHLKMSRVMPSYEPSGDRIISLGRNMYASADSITNVTQSQAVKGGTCENLVLDPKAKSQIEVLTKLIGVKANKSSEVNNMNFQLDLFDVDVADDDDAIKDDKQLEQRLDTSNILKIDASKRKENCHLSKIMEELSIKNEEKGDDDDDDDLFDFNEES